MKIENDEFYMLEADEKHVFDTEEKAVEEMKKKVGDVEEVEDPDVLIWRVDTSGGDWSIRQVPWSKIAMQMIKGERK